MIAIFKENMDDSKCDLLPLNVELALQLLSSTLQHLLSASGSFHFLLHFCCNLVDFALCSKQILFDRRISK